jgi:pyruvate dehydrogenase E2 component (dihydrolipoamide acetyltransferase)
VRPAAVSSGERPMNSMRSAIAQRLHRSLQEMAQLTIGMDASVDRLLALRADMKAGSLGAVAPTITDFVVRAAAIALVDHPALNASVVGGDVVALHDRPHIGVAVALDDGLVVPVVRDADALTVRAIAAATRTLAAAARAGNLDPDDLSGATFCVTSLGSRGVDFFTPIVNPPNVAILGIGGVRDGVRFTGKRKQKPAHTSVLTLSLTFDHRAVDGAPAADFLATVREYLARPARLM